ncbi:phosphonate ABC transporter, permease protein PhnE [Haloferacaceae archaeon DSL9]
MGVENPRRWKRFDRRERLTRYLLTLLSLVVVVASWRWLAMDLQYISTAPAEMADLLARMYPPAWSTTPTIIAPLIETIHIAVVGTIVALSMSVPVAFLVAENTTPNRLTYALGKLIVTVTRSVHIIIWALLFIVILGNGALAGTAAIAVRSVGFCGKLLGEEIEEIDFAQVEAVRATGASSLQTLFYGIVPQIKPALVGISIYRWDINVRGATILGFVGAGGIGMQLFAAIDSFQWRAVSVIILAILLIVFASEAVSAYARAKVR